MLEIAFSTMVFDSAERRVQLTLVRFTPYASSFYYLWSIFASLKRISLLRKIYKCERCFSLVRFQL